MHKFFLVILSCSFALVSCSQDSTIKPVEHIAKFRLGNTDVDIIIEQYGERDDICMLNLHDDETTSMEAARQVLARYGGMMIRINNGQKRILRFTSTEGNFAFDPNRMFTVGGLHNSLVKHGQLSTQKALDDIQQFARFLLDKIPTATKTLITLHNNDEGRLSILSYMDKGEYVDDVAAVSQSASRDPDNFFLTTDPKLYDLIREEYNAVLQDNKKAADDGSLSIYYGRNSASYVNVEAQVGQISEQKDMIEVLVRFLRD